MFDISVTTCHKNFETWAAEIKLLKSILKRCFKIVEFRDSFNKVLIIKYFVKILSRLIYK